MQVAVLIYFKYHNVIVYKLVRKQLTPKDIQKTCQIQQLLPIRPAPQIESHELKKVNSYILLDQMFVNMEDDKIEDILNWAKLGQKAFGQFHAIFKSNKPTCLKRKLFSQCLLPVLTYAKHKHSAEFECYTKKHEKANV